jgi:hypothetical protein
MIAFTLDAKAPSFSMRTETRFLEFHSFEKILVALQSSAGLP